MTSSYGFFSAALLRLRPFPLLPPPPPSLPPPSPLFPEPETRPGPAAADGQKLLKLLS